MLQESATVKIDWKLTTVPLITAIRARPYPIASKGGGNTQTTGTLKLTETALTCTLVIISNNYCMHHCYKAMCIYLELIDQFLTCYIEVYRP